jgi:hypothetical protein
MSKIAYYLELGPLQEVDCIVEYDYQPAERMTAFYPGCDEKIEITDVILDGVTLSPRILSALIEALQGDDSLMDKIHEAETFEMGEE